MKTHFAIVTKAVVVLKFPMQSRRFLPTVRQVLSFTALTGFSAHTIFPYVTFLFLGTSALGIAIMVLVPFMSLMPCANCPSSFENERSQINLSFAFYEVTIFFNGASNKMDNRVCIYILE